MINGYSVEIELEKSSQDNIFDQLGKDSEEKTYELKHKDAGEWTVMAKLMFEDHVITKSTFTAWIISCEDLVLNWKPGSVLENGKIELNNEDLLEVSIEDETIAQFQSDEISE